jgi:hypothetical protein
MTEYSEERSTEILNRIAEGQMLTRICTEEGMPDRLTFYRWMIARPPLANAYARARLMWADFWAEKVLLLSLDGSGDIYLDESGKSVVDHANVQRARLQADTIKWLVGKYAPRVYGEKSTLELEVPAAPLQPILRIERVIVGAPDSRLAERIKELEAQLGIGAEPPESKAPRQLTWDPAPMPTRLHGEIVVRLVGLIKSRVPAADQRPPEAVLDELFGIIDRALIAEYGAS